MNLFINYVIPVPVDELNNSFNEQDREDAGEDSDDVNNSLTKGRYVRPLAPYSSTTHLSFLHVRNPPCLTSLHRSPPEFHFNLHLREQSPLPLFFISLHPFPLLEWLDKQPQTTKLLLADKTR